MSDADLNELTEEVLTALEKLPGTPTAQEIQNVVEEKLLAADYAKTANAYINYRTVAPGCPFAKSAAWAAIL